MARLQFPQVLPSASFCCLNFCLPPRQVQTRLRSCSCLPTTRLHVSGDVVKEPVPGAVLQLVASSNAGDHPLHAEIEGQVMHPLPKAAHLQEPLVQANGRLLDRGLEGLIWHLGSSLRPGLIPRGRLSARQIEPSETMGHDNLSRLSSLTHVLR